MKLHYHKCETLASLGIPWHALHEMRGETSSCRNCSGSGRSARENFSRHGGD
jgi:hypothetical protein